jgi:hypothetical protein
MRSRKDPPRRHQSRVPHPEQSEGWDTAIPGPDSKRDNVGEFPTSVCTLPQTPFFVHYDERLVYPEPDSFRIRRFTRNSEA